MHSHKLLLEFGTRDFDYICRSCLSTLQKRALPTRATWPRPVRHSSLQAWAPSKNNRPTDVATATDKEAERRKVLEILGLHNNEQKNVTVNYFEQGDFGRLRRLDDRNDFQTSLADPGGMVDTRLKHLEEQMEQARLLIKKLKGIAKNAAEEDEADQDTIEIREASAKPFYIPPEGWRQDHGDMVGRLNKIIRYAVHQSKDGGVKIQVMNRLWSCYTRTRFALSTRQHVVPLRTWELLWSVFAADIAENPNRMSRVYLLSKDMQLADVPLTDEQQLLALEAMFVEGWKDEAIENHKRYISTLGTKPETFMDFWQLILRMHCLVGDIGQAQVIVDKILASPYQKDPRFLLPFIRACAADPTTVEMGYDAYRQFKTLLGASMTKPDYDQVIFLFLASNQTEYGLYIFVDMMTSGALDIRRGRRLPPTVANPFFFGKWVKRLIGGGDLKGAYNVLVFMKEKNIPPRPIQVNALLGSLLRSQTAENIEQAEKIGWAMINTRIQFVITRRAMLRLEKPVDLQPAGDGWPNATLETFQLLAENYKDRKLHNKMEALWTAFRETELAPNTFMMNQLLLSSVQDGQGNCVPDLFRNFNKIHNIKADPWTFVALWQSLPINRLLKLPRGGLQSQRSKNRALFAEMMESAPVFVTEGVNALLSKTILHTFRKAKDIVGLLAAVRALRYVFNSIPPEALIIELLMRTTNLEKALHKHAMKSRLVTHVHRIEHYLEHQRRELVKAGKLKEDDSLPEATKREEMCNFLELNLETECEKKPMYGGRWELALRKAVEEMGLYKEQ